MLAGGAAVQKDPNKLEKRAGRNLMKFNNDKYKVLHCLQSPHSQCRLAADCLGNTFAEKGLRLPADYELNKTQKCTSAAV